MSLTALVSLGAPFLLVLVVLWRAHLLARMPLLLGTGLLIALPLLARPFETQLIDPIAEDVFGVEYRGWVAASPTASALATHFPDEATAIRLDVTKEFRFQGRLSARKLFREQAAVRSQAFLSAGVMAAPPDDVTAMAQNTVDILDHLLGFADDRCWGWLNGVVWRQPVAETDPTYARHEAQAEQIVGAMLGKAANAAGTPAHIWSQADLERFEAAIARAQTTPPPEDPQLAAFPNRAACHGVRAVLGIGLPDQRGTEGRSATAAPGTDVAYLRWLLAAR